jgi:hypothetical protein
MKKTIRLTESELIHLVKRIIKEQEGFDQLDDTPLEDEPSLDDLENFDDDIEDYGFDIEDDFDEDDDFQSKMRHRERMRQDRPSSVGLGGATRWDSESDREVKKGGWSPIKPDDLPLEKFAKSKYNKFK